MSSSFYNPWSATTQPDPRTFHFHALEVVNRLHNDDELLHALLEYGDAPKNGIPFPC